jgi:hypothetical protein
MIRADHEPGEPIVPYEREEELPLNHEEALLAAFDVLGDAFADELEDMSDAEYVKESFMSTFLPPKFRRRYTKNFGRKFLTCLRAVGWKFRAPGVYRLGSVGEEMAMFAAIRFAEGQLMDEGVKEPDFNLFRGAVFEDNDYEDLFRPELDGIEDDQRMGYANLRFSEWFEPFNSAARPSRSACSSWPSAVYFLGSTSVPAFLLADVSAGVGIESKREIIPAVEHRVGGGEGGGWLSGK